MSKFLIRLLGVVVIFAAYANVAYAGFGITPPYVRNATLRPGSQYTQEIIIVRSDPVDDLQAELSFNLPAIESWISVDRGLSFLLPKGESQVRMNVTVRVPEDARLGDYNGNIRIRTTSPQGPTTGVSLALGAQIDVHLKVVEEIYDFEVRRVELFEAESGTKFWWLDFPGKIKFGMHIENTGNVPASPFAVRFDIYDVAGQAILERTDATNQPERILPFDTKRVFAYLPTFLPPGGYRVKYTIEKEEGAVAQRGELALSILPPGTITGYEKYGFEGLTLGDKLSILLPAGLLVLATLGFLFVGRRGRTSRVSTAHRERERVPRDSSSHADHPQVRPRPRTSAGGVVDLSRK